MASVDPSQPSPPKGVGASHTAAAGAGLYQCADCQRRYSRPEHLARHIQTHTLGKRFFCSVCNKAFARADLLKRHAANHATDSDTKKRKRSGTGPDSGRVSHACRACASARVKCEEEKPCSRCRTRNITCDFSTSEAGSRAAMHLLHLSANGGQIHQTENYQPQLSPSSQSQQPQHASSPLSQMQQQYQSPDKHQNYGATQGTSITQVEYVQPEMGQEVLQLATPETLDQCSSDSINGNFAGDNPPLDMAQMQFSHFLRDIMTLDPYAPPRTDNQGLELLNFCGDTGFEMNEMDFGLLGYYSEDLAGQLTHEESEDPMHASGLRHQLAKIWTESPWQWTPNKADTAYCEQSHLPVPAGEPTSRKAENLQVPRVVASRLDPSCRDRVLALVLSTCQSPATATRVASSWPSAEVMDSFIHYFLTAHLCQTDSWIHVSTIKLARRPPLWHGAAAAAGAALTPIAALKRFGYALQEAVRVKLPDAFESNNSKTRDLDMLQAFLLNLDTGLWSGNRRKMEIAESHCQTPTTMLRRARKFQRSTYQTIVVHEEDEGEVLEKKWQSWVTNESFKRLAFHNFLRDAQQSMTTLTKVIMSYSELSLPLPEPRELWFAKNAQEWKELYRRIFPQPPERLPSLTDALRDITVLTAHQHYLDMQLTTMLYTHAIWGMIDEYRQMNSTYRTSTLPPGSGLRATTNTSLLLNTRHQDLCTMLFQFQEVSASWTSGNPPNSTESLTLNLLLMNLYVSLDDVQIFAGKDGEDPARKVYPSLLQWAESREARQAVWHAGQVLRAAKDFPKNHLKDFYAVAVHHASIALWAYGVITLAQNRTQSPRAIPNGQGHRQFVFIDGPESNETQRFIAVRKDIPAIRGPKTSAPSGQEVVASVEDPRNCMEVAHQILRDNCANEDNVLPLMVENLCQLIKQLGNAAWAAGLS